MNLSFIVYVYKYCLQKNFFLGGFNLGALFAEAEASDNLLERKQFNLKLVKEFRIKDGTVGFGYDTIFGDGIDERLKVVIVDEPYLRNRSQVCHF